MKKLRLSAGLLLALVSFGAHAQSELVSGLAGRLSALNGYVIGHGSGALTASSTIPCVTAATGAVCTVANNAALEALSVGALPAGTIVHRAGYTTAGDRGDMDYAGSGSACSLNSGAGDGGSQVPSADGKCWVWKPRAGAIHAEAFGALPDWNGTTGTDNSTAIANWLAAIGTGGNAEIGPGSFKYSSLTVPTGAWVHGTGDYGTALVTTNLTGTAITVGVSGIVSDANLTAVSPQTSGTMVALTGNAARLDRFQMSNYYIGVYAQGASGSNVIVGPRITRGNMYSPSIQSGATAIIGLNYGGLFVQQMTISGPSSGTQPFSSIRLLNGDTAIIDGVNATLHGSLRIDPGNGQNVYATQVTNSLFDSSHGNPNVMITPTGTGNVYQTKIATTWVGLANTDNMLIQSQGTGVVDGVELDGVEFPGVAGTTGSGLRVDGAGVMNLNVNGGWASGVTYGYNFSGGVSHFSVRGVRARNVGGRGAISNYGIVVQSGASDYYQIENNDLQGNTQVGVSDSGTGTHKTVTDNLQ